MSVRRNYRTSLATMAKCNFPKFASNYTKDLLFHQYFSNVRLKLKMSVFMENTSVQFWECDDTRIVDIDKNILPVGIYLLKELTIETLEQGVKYVQS